MRRLALILTGLLLVASACTAATAPEPPRSPLDPRGKIHMPIGLPNTLDSLKTFVEAEGNFSPGFATYGIYFWVYDHEAKKLYAPTMEGVKCERELMLGFAPATTWQAGNFKVITRVAESRRSTPQGEVFLAAASVSLNNEAAKPGRISLYVAVRPIGAAGGPIHRLSVGDDGSTLYVDGHVAVYARTKPSAVGVLPTDTIGDLAMAGEMPSAQSAESPTGDCSGAMRFDLRPEHRTLVGGWFFCPILPGRRAVAHQWDGKSPWAQIDLARPNPPEGGILQPDPDIGFLKSLTMGNTFCDARSYWQDSFHRSDLSAPDKRWNEAMRAINMHAAIAMNDGAPDVAVINYNVYNRDGAYATSIFQTSGQFDLAAAAIDYFLAHPFNGRAFPEADNPGQVLWTIGEHWLFTRDEKWLARVYPGVQKLAAMIRYYRTTPGPHWVAMDSLDFGDALPAEKRQELKPGRCDGTHPEYTEAFDIAGLRHAATVARGMKNEADAAAWSALADSFAKTYAERFNADLAKGYGSYCVLWPCRLYPLGLGSGYETFKAIGGQTPGKWYYFPLARAHQGLLAGNREAGYKTVQAYLDLEMMQGWYLLDEGGKSGSGGWQYARTTWNGAVAMPHGWSVAELWHLMRDSLLFEDGDRLVLLAGVPPEWFTASDAAKETQVNGMATHFGPCTFKYTPGAGGAKLEFSTDPGPPGGYVLRLPAALKATVKIAGKPVEKIGDTDFLLPRGTKQADVEFAAKS